MEHGNNLREEVLVAKAQLRDSVAFEELVRVYHLRLLYFVQKMLLHKHLAEDVMQEVWAIVFAKLPRLRAAQAFSVWVYRIAYTEATKMIRTESQYVELPDEFDALDNATDSNNQFSDEDIAQLNAAIDLLPHHLREVIVLRFLEDMSYEEISQVTGVALGTVKSRIHNAKRQLRQKLEERKL